MRVSMACLSRHSWADDVERWSITERLQGKSAIVTGAARGIGLRLQVIPAGTQADIDAAFLKLVREKAQALGWLDAAYEQHDPAMTTLSFVPEFDSLRDDPRFQDLVRRVGIPPVVRN